MKKMFPLLILVNLMILSFISVDAQNSRINIGLSRDLFAVPLSEKSLLSEQTKVYLGYNLNKLNLRLGFDNFTIKDNVEKQYNELPGVSVDLGYFVYDNMQKNLSSEIYGSFSNSLSKFSKFENYHTDLGLRFYYYKMFFLATGVRYFKNELGFVNYNQNNINWYWQLGIQISLKTKK